MELIYLAHILLRHLWKIVLISILIAAGAFGYVYGVMKPEYKNTIVFSTTAKVDTSLATDKTYDPFAYFQASDLFAETMLGWFRSPQLFQDLKQRVPEAANLPLDSLIKVRKQEKQNLNILFSVPDKALADKLGTELIAYLRERVANVNKVGNTTYELVDVAPNVELSKPSPLVIGATAGAVALALLSFLFLLWDLLRGVVLYPQQAEEAMGGKALGTAKDPSDVAALAAFVAKQEKPVAVVQTWAGKDDLTLALAHACSDDLARKTLLIEGARGDTALMEQGSGGKRLARAKGFFDHLKPEELANVAMPITPEQPLLRFIGAGEGHSPSAAHLTTLRQQNDVVLLHTTLPQNPYILTQSDVVLVVAVKTGETRQKLLRHIARISDAPHVLFFV